MTSKIDSNGDLTWIDGDILYSVDQNDTIENKGFRLDASSIDATEYSQAGTVWTTKKTWTFTPISARNLVVAVQIDGERKYTGGVGGSAPDIRVTFDGTAIASLPSGATTSYTSFSKNWQLQNITTLANLDLGGESSYVLTVDLRAATGGGETAWLKDHLLTITYLDNGKLTTSSTKIA